MATRRLRARQLRERIERGPAFFDGKTLLTIMNKDERELFRRAYGVWVETWVLPELDNLIPELRKPVDKPVNGK